MYLCYFVFEIQLWLVVLPELVMATSLQVALKGLKKNWVTGAWFGLRIGLQGRDLEYWTGPISVGPISQGTCTAAYKLLLAIDVLVHR